MREDAVHVIPGVHFTHDGWDVLSEVGTEHASSVEPGILRVPRKFSPSISFEPLRMRFQGVFPLEIRAHTGQNSNAALLGGGTAIAEEVTLTEEFPVLVIRNLRRIKRKNAGHANLDGIHF